MRATPRPMGAAALLLLLGLWGQPAFGTAGGLAGRLPRADPVRGRAPRDPAAARRAGLPAAGAARGARSGPSAAVGPVRELRGVHGEPRLRPTDHRSRATG